MDADYANTPGTDESGRYISAWRIVDGKLAVNAIQGFSWDMVMQMPVTGREYILDPSVYTGADGNNLIANMGSPIKENGEMRAAVGCTIELSTIQTIVEEIKPFGDGFALLFSQGGIVAAHSDSKRLGKDMRESEQDTFGPHLDTMVNAVTTGTPASFSYRPPNSTTIIQYYAEPFTIGHFPSPWTMVVGVSQNTIMAPVYRMLGISLIIGFLSIIFMSIGVFFMARSISRPVNTLARILKDISEGEGDLTKTIAITEKNEIGDLAHYFNLTIDKIERLVVVIKKEGQSLSQTGSALAGNMAETAASINEITAHIQDINSKANKQEASVKGTNIIMGQVVENIEMLNNQIQKQTAYVSRSSSEVEQMLAKIESVTQTLIKNEVNVTKLAQASEIGRTGLEGVSGDIREIAKESEGLLEINAVMENIASQTDLLSMNAAIEAAHAGEAGKGFAVVADEIRKLAESSGEQSKTISDVLTKIKNSIDKITAATNEVLLNFESISEGVKTVTLQEANVRKTMEEQGAGSKAILESMSGLNEITMEVKRSAHGMISGSREVIKESKTLEQLTGEIEDGMQEMAGGARQIDSAVHKVNDITMENKRQIELLMAEVARFKVVSD
jgi:methyl-accepting chemotaxis protein